MQWKCCSYLYWCLDSARSPHSISAPSLAATIAGRPVSQSKKKHTYSCLKEKAIKKAVDMYQMDQKKTNGSKPRGYWACRDQVVADFAKANTPVLFTYEVVRKCDRGLPSLAKSHEKQKKLSPEATKTFVKYVAAGLTVVVSEHGTMNIGL
jgi:hypothetical protein